MVYCYYRMGRLAAGIEPKDKMLLGLFLCNQQPITLLEYFRPEWNAAVQSDLDKKISLVGREIGIAPDTEAIFIFKKELSESVNGRLFGLSFLEQPKVFIRVRPGKSAAVERKLKLAEFVYRRLDFDCLELQQGAKVDAVLKLDEEAVIQDYNSQKTARLLKSVTQGNGGVPLRCWDSCAGSGGKSIMTFDQVKKVQLTVSDKRTSILKNLHKRFVKAGIKNYHYFIADLSKPDFAFPRQVFSHPPTNPLKPVPLEIQLFDLIICDIPCTGSGTWSRTPEQLYFFNLHQLEKYTTLQKQILSNIIPYLAPGGKLLYITCSVFREENESNVSFIKEKFGMKVDTEQLLPGYKMNADTLYAALLTAPIV